MKRPIAIVTLVIAGIFVPAIARSVQAQEQCSVATLRGDYVLTGEGQARFDQRDDPTYPRIFAGVWSFDGEGNLTASVTRSLGGRITSRAASQATYTLEPDCTGLLSFGAGEEWELFVTRDGRMGAAIRVDIDKATGLGSIATRSFKVQ